MHIVVCVKQVPKSLQVQIDPVTHNLVREGTEGILNPFDENALEEALRLREKGAGRVSVISMGPPQVRETLRKALALGADEAYLLSDRRMGGADVLATAYTLSLAIDKLKPVDLILCGRHAVDSDTGQVGPELAELLGWEQASLVKSLDWDGQLLTARRETEGGEAVWVLPLPALITVGKEINKPRYPTPLGIVRSGEKTITEWDADDLQADLDRIGLAGSPTRVIRAFRPERQSKVEMIEGEVGEMAETLLARLRREGLIRS